MKDSILLTFLYRTLPGRALLKLLVQPGVSRMAGRFLSSGASARIVPYYIKKHHIDMSGVEIPAGGFPSFNAFFTRKRKLERCDAAAGRLISPCDGLLTSVEIRDGTVLRIKHTEFSLTDLLADAGLAAAFRDGLALIFRLTPEHYHRYCHAADGRVLRHRKISGELHCVRPVALRTLPVFVRNSREYQLVRTEDFGLMVQMEVGALLVGKIRNRSVIPGENRVRAGAEKGYFEFGGSTIILLLQKDAVRLRGSLYAKKNEQGEIPVRQGECVAITDDTA